MGLAMKKRTVEPYGLAVQFERALVTMLGSRPKLYERVGRHIEADALGLPSARLLLLATRAIAEEHGPPDGAAVVVQRLASWRRAGKVQQEQVDAAVDLLDAAEDGGLPGEEHIVAELVPILRRRAEGDAIRDLIAAHGKSEDTHDLADRLQRAARLGESDVDSPGVQLGTGSFEAIEKLKQLVRLPIGVVELDALLDGGLWRGGLGTIVADTGGGKSMMLAHQAAHATSLGFSVAYATLELPEAIVLARLKANLTGVPTNAILAGSSDARQRMAEIEASLGVCVVKSFTPRATAVPDLLEWVAGLEKVHKRPFDLLCVDYADKLGVRAPGEVSSYQAGELVYEGLRLFAFDNNKWVWTASQAKGRDKKKKRLDTSDVADSMGKVRVADVVLTATFKSDADEVLWFKAKDRLGQANRSVGPLPHDFERGRIAPTVGDFDNEGWDDAW